MTSACLQNTHCSPFRVRGWGGGEPEYTFCLVFFLSYTCLPLLESKLCEDRDCASLVLFQGFKSPAYYSTGFI